MPFLRRILFVQALIASSSIAQAVSFGESHQVSNSITLTQPVATTQVYSGADLIAIENGGQAAVTWSNNGRGVFTRAAQWDNPVTYQGISGKTESLLGMADIDNDGRKELLALWNFGTDAAPARYVGFIRSDPTVGYVPSYVLFAATDILDGARDLTGDGSVDFLTRNGSWINDSSGHFTFVSGDALPDEAFADPNGLPRSFWAGDNNASGRDAFFFQSASGLVRKGINSGNGSFQLADTSLTLPANNYLAGAVNLSEVSPNPCLLVEEDDPVTSDSLLALYVKKDGVYARTTAIALAPQKNITGTPTVSVQMDQGKPRIFVSIHRSTPDHVAPYPPTLLTELIAHGNKASGKITLSLKQIGSYEAYAFTPLLADVNGDGVNDLVLSLVGDPSYKNSIIGILWQAGNRMGSFSGARHSVTSPLQDLSLVYAGDLDGDGAADVLTVSSSTFSAASGLTLWHNSGKAESFLPKIVFQHSQLIQVVSVKKPVGENPLEIVVLCSTPGRKDTDPYTNEVIRLTFTKTGRVQQKFLLRAKQTEWYLADLADSDGDGIPDIRIAYFSPNDGEHTDWYRGLANGRFQLQPHTATSFVFNQDTLVDVDWDCDMDTWNLPQWTENDGSAGGAEHALPNYQTVTEGGLSFYFGGILPVAYDFDGDGHPDYLSYQSDGTVTPLLARGTGDRNSPFYPFDTTTLAIATPLPNVTGLSFLDLDGDGLVDAVYPGLETTAVTFRKNLGGGQFGPATTVAPGSSFTRDKFMSADLDGDGIPDLISTSTSGTRLEWFKGK